MPRMPELHLATYAASCAALATLLGAASTLVAPKPPRSVARFLVRALHFFTHISFAFYLVARGGKVADVAYLVTILLVFAHWQLYGECVLSYLDEKLADPAYPGRAPGTLSISYLRDLLGPKATNVFLVVMMALTLATYFVVLWRLALPGVAKGFFAVAFVVLGAASVSDKRMASF